MATKAKPLVSSDSTVRFEVFRDGKQAETHLLLGPVIRIGKSGSFGLHLDGEGVQPFHALVEAKSQEHVVVRNMCGGDLWVDQVSIEHSAQLRSGSRMTIGTVDVLVLLGEDRYIK